MSLYQIWRLDCEACGEVTDLGEDHPGRVACPECGEETEE